MSVSEKRILIIMSKVFLFSLTIPHSNIHTKIFCSMGKVAFRFRPSRQKKSRFHRIKSSIQICLKAWLEFHLSMYVLFAFKKSKQTIAILQEGVSGLSGKFWVGSVLLMLCSHIFTPKAFLWQESGEVLFLHNLKLTKSCFSETWTSYLVSYWAKTFRSITYLLF